jgi:endonuclease/exonuclease/phosphatase family metal-dependent hydrolase
MARRLGTLKAERALSVSAFSANHMLHLRFYLFLCALLAAIGPLAVRGVAEDAALPANLKLLSWNIQMLPTALSFASEKLQKGQTLRAPWIIEYLNEQDYDLVVLQEVIDPAITAQLKEGLRSTYPHIVSVDAQQGVSGCSGGILFAGRVPIKYVDHIVFKHITGVDKLAEKGCVLVEGQRDGVRFQVAGTHLQAGDDETRDKEFAEIGESIIAPHKQDGVPQLLVGDMNVAATEPSYRLLLSATDMTDAPLSGANPFTVDGHNSWNQPNKRPKHIDHVLINPRGTSSRIVRQTVQRARREHEGKTIDYADHYGVIASVQMKP